MTFELDADFCFEAVPCLTWGEIRVGYMGKFMSTLGVVSYASDALKIDSLPAHYELAIQQANDVVVIESLLERLSSEGDQVVDDPMRVWVYLQFLYLYKLAVERDEAFSMAEASRFTDGSERLSSEPKSIEVEGALVWWLSR